MPSRKLKNKNTRNLIRMGRAGSSLGLTLPKEMTTSLGWREKQKVKVKRTHGGILIKDWKK
ncbi:MAG TPA: AbrB/MazE/SpoVT family DNA-binding domain-containing protein [Candidatus Moranbacteria bacterium]|jgi:antitoxin component of MazEF toxin-antitoxin module|nr:AbrB/MazE/SpoVT family DNA-binding domain-containing protein [Candidatus Moranbacteria bacterium]HPX94163.1 AbrB/MazE/SpoVT family DNA-binding domain-containing protein [Candidatus Moranbacteria bacterium]HQB59223.1 AbrB/MazE/SpoVT family DNA-binding domain-containing protein [Candidatus Moranbacteria bacterium]